MIGLRAEASVIFASRALAADFQPGILPRIPGHNLGDMGSRQGVQPGPRSWTYQRSFFISPGPILASRFGSQDGTFPSRSLSAC